MTESPQQLLERMRADRNSRADEAPKPVEFPPILWADQVVEMFPEMRRIIIDGQLRAGEIMNMIGAPKTKKTLLAMDQAMSVSLGRCWLNTIQTTQAKVLYLDLECHAETLARRIRDIAAERGVMLPELNGNLGFMSMRGRVTTLEGLRPLMEKIKGDGYGLIYIDAKYRLQASAKGEDQANNNSAETAWYNLLDEFARITGAAFVCVHHDNKGWQAHKAITDRGSGAGAQSRAPDAHFTITPHAEDDCYVLEGVVRSFAQPKPVVMRWQYPVFSIDSNLDPSDLRKPGRQTEPEDEEPDWTADAFVNAVFTNDKFIKKDVVRARATKAGIDSNRKADQLLALAMDENLVIEDVKGKAKSYGRFKGEL